MNEFILYIGVVLILYIVFYIFIYIIPEEIKKRNKKSNIKSLNNYQLQEVKKGKESILEEKNQSSESIIDDKPIVKNDVLNYYALSDIERNSVSDQDIIEYCNSKIENLESRSHTEEFKSKFINYKYQLENHYKRKINFKDAINNEIALSDERYTKLMFPYYEKLWKLLGMKVDDSYYYYFDNNEFHKRVCKVCKLYQLGEKKISRNLLIDTKKNEILSRYNYKIYSRGFNINDIKYNYVFDYIPQRLHSDQKYSNKTLIDIYKFILNFKNGNIDTIQLANFLANIIADIIPDIYLNKNFYLCVIPSSNKYDNDLRYKELINEISKILGINNGFTIISRKFDIDKSIQNGIKNNIDVLKGIEISIDLNGKSIILLDDVITTGNSLKEFYKLMINNNVKEIYPLFLSRTIYDKDLKYSLDIDYNVNNYDLFKGIFRNSILDKNKMPRFSESEVQKTYNLFQSGHSIEEIVSIQGKDENEILNHLEIIQKIHPRISDFNISPDLTLIELYIKIGYLHLSGSFLSLKEFETYIKRNYSNSEYSYKDIRLNYLLSKDYELEPSF